MQRSDDRHASVLDVPERSVPDLRVLHQLKRRALAVLAYVQTGAEVVAVAEQERRP
ncbi:MAG TPA: hypothetical protein VHF51_11555 [Solirubrobacteraceae bacterium]|nr:hypothetical protein [Solirubrobacteraceae bacterium]